MPLEKSKYESFVLITEEEDLLSLYELYHENSKLDPDVSLPDFKKIAEIRNNPAFIAIMAKAFKEYPGCPQIPLPMEVELGNVPIGDVIRQRRSVRNFTGEAITRDELSALLLYSNGISGQFTYMLQKPEIQYLRAAPSAGGLYPIEIYPVILNVTGLEQGIYHYKVKEHALEQLQKGDCHNVIPPLLSNQPFTKNCAALFILTAIFKRTTLKYGQRGYRFVMLDAGHIGQNVYLAATSLFLGCVGIGGFFERQLEEVLKLDGVEESVVYVLGVGKPDLEKPYAPPVADWE